MIEEFEDVKIEKEVNGNQYYYTVDHQENITEVIPDASNSADDHNGMTE